MLSVSNEDYERYISIHMGFHGFPSLPISIYHTGEEKWPWIEYTDPTYPNTPKKAESVFDHRMIPVWNDVGREIYKFFDSADIKWTSLDPLRFVKDEYQTPPSPVYICVGVLPETLSPDNAQSAAIHCKEILKRFQITDVEIAFRESVFSRSVGPKLYNTVCIDEPLSEVVSPLTPALGLRISPKAFPNLEGTGGVYICEGGESNRVFVLTARHVVLPPHECSNDIYIYGPGQHRHDVILFGNQAYERILEFIIDKIGELARQFRWSSVNDFASDEGSYAEKCSKKKVQAWIELCSQMITSWSSPDERILGHVVYAPPISDANAGDDVYTADWALVELHHDKIDWKEFNVIVDRPSLTNLPRLRWPHYGGSDWSAILLESIFPLVQGVVKEDVPDQSTTSDSNNQESIDVVKNSNATGLTFGRVVTPMKSYVREYDDDHKIKSTFMAIAIHQNYFATCREHPGFSAPGDSGAIVAGRQGNLIGMVVGSTGSLRINHTDVTYLTPYRWIEECIREVFPEAYLYPTLF